MAVLTPRFRKLCYRLIGAGAFIVAAFYLGMYAYVWNVGRQPAHAAVTTFSPALSVAITKPLTLTINGTDYVIPPTQMSAWVEPYTRTYTGQQDIRFSERLDADLSDLAAKTRQDPVDAKFIFTNNQPEVITPAQIGHEINIAQADEQIRTALLTGQTSVTLALEDVPPAITAQTISTLGITTELAEGESNFAGSSAARIQNIKVSSALYNGMIIKPGETFSFDDNLGPVDATGGYEPEKVIIGNAIEYQYGGGICQVSTTLFRAAILAGLPIVERKNHSFPVAYYNPQGFDATVYPGSADLKFTNNTPGDILIQTHMSGTYLYFELYGTSDGRVVTMDGPHSYDVQADGAMKAYFVRTIFANGASTSQTFTSVYNSPKLYPTEPNPYE